MEKFSLEKYLENPNRKVVTRDGRPVRIICWDRQCELEYNYPVIALVLVENTEVPVISNKEGKTWNNNEINSLFFADEEEKLNEFEKELEMMMVSFSNGNLGSDIITEMPKQKLHNYAHRLLDLARKEIEIEDWRRPLRFYKNGYKQGKQYALKDLPKWKKATEYKELDRYVAIIDYNNKVALTDVLDADDYYIEFEDLLKLPKEE